MRWINSRFFTGIVSLFLVWMLFSTVSVELEKDEAKREVKNMESKIEEIKKNNQILEKLINNFDNPVFLEREARSRLNYKGQGEEVVFVYRDSTPSTASSSEKFSLDNLPNYKKWWHWLLAR